MWMLPSTVRIYVATTPVDLRAGFDALAAVARQTIHADPLAGHLFVFFNRPRNRVKVLWWDRGGYCIFYKRLARGCFAPNLGATSRSHVAIDSAELALMLEGIDLRGSLRSPRWEPHRADDADRFSQHAGSRTAENGA
jgi:transposase